ncbi:MAG TPA: c-type cytochrome [Longimicrobiales bacterium]|nr:c-type cytochrome [Longimicrobiales bacterium]
MNAARSRTLTLAIGAATLVAATLLVLAVAGADAAGPTAADQRLEQVLRGRQLVITHDCGACHGGGTDPRSDDWLVGGLPGAGAGLRVLSRNLTPDPETGIGRYTERQLFNAMRWGLRPSATPDVDITSATPGVGNHPLQPDYLAPAMPWTSWRNLSDQELWDMIAYLMDGVRAVRNDVPESEKPADRWAGWFRPEVIGPYPILPFPAAGEELRAPDRLEEVLRGRRLVTSMGCGECHGGRGNPASPHWLAGTWAGAAGDTGTAAADVPAAVVASARAVTVTAGPYEGPFVVGELTVRARNLTPDNVTGVGSFSERQLFNALRWGLRPGETEDAVITSHVPGEGNHPVHPKYLPPMMPWVAFRQLADDELRDIVAYLKYGVRPNRHRVPASDGPPDFWAGVFAPAALPPMPPPAFPTARERGRF